MRNCLQKGQRGYMFGFLFQECDRRLSCISLVSAAGGTHNARASGRDTDCLGHPPVLRSTGIRSSVVGSRLGNTGGTVTGRPIHGRKI
jgi:hypothetical protein